MTPFLAAEAEARLKQKAADEAAAKKASEEAKKRVRKPSEPELTDAQIDSQFELIAVKTNNFLALTNSLFQNYYLLARTARTWPQGRRHRQDDQAAEACADQPEQEQEKE